MKLMFVVKSMKVPGGGAERVLSIVASGLARRGHDVTLVTFDRPGAGSFYEVDSRVHRFGLGVGPTSSRTGPAAFARRIPALRRVVRDARPDVAVGFMHSAFVPLGLSLIGTGVPMVASEHTVPEYYRGKPVEFALFRVGCRLSRRTTVLSEAVRASYPRTLRVRMVAVSNPVAGFENCRADPAGESKDVKTVLSVGRLDRGKDHATLIEAFASIAGSFPEWRVRIVGEGACRRDLEDAVVRHGLKERVSLPGATDRVDLEYARAQFVAVPSRFESFGMVTAEALCVGIPVLGFADCPGTNELVRHGENGWLVTAARGEDRVGAFARGLATLMEDPELRVRLGARARRTMREFGPDSAIDCWEELLAEVAGVER